jgi:predicted SAM-dependent methyltransferase
VVSTSLLKRIVKRRSTQQRLRNLQSALSEFWSDVTKELVHGGDLGKYCTGKVGLKLHVGCGELVRPGWVNIDFSPRLGVFYFNMQNPLPIANGTVSRIHAEHFLEHLEYSEAVRFLSECARILAGGGSMRVIIPDAEKYMRAYASDDKLFFEKLKDLGGTLEPLPTKDAICNQMFRMGGDHQFAWDFETLEYVSKLAGFKIVKRSHHNEEPVSVCIDGQDWWRPVESLYAELQT